MSLSVEQITEEALSLPSEARALLADRLAESLDPADDDRLKKLWVAEVRRRSEEIRSGKVQPIPAEEVFAEARHALAS